MSITAAMVKDLRERTGVGMMDCKKALAECDGDEEKAIAWLREKGLSKAAKKAEQQRLKGLRQEQRGAKNPLHPGKAVTKARRSQGVTTRGTAVEGHQRASGRRNQARRDSR
jgi:hypothetical protein